MNNCTLIGDRAYISADYQTGLFIYSNINLFVPMRKNQNHFVKFSKTKAKIRKRIETNFSQLHGQFSWTVNHAKSFLGLTMIQLLKSVCF